jgi:hypothetical protein
MNNQDSSRSGRSLGVEEGAARIVDAIPERRILCNDMDDDISIDAGVTFVGKEVREDEQQDMQGDEGKPLIQSTTIKCSRRGCKLGENGLLACASMACRKLLHSDCFQKGFGNQVFFQEMFDAGEVVCTKSCFEKLLKSKTSRPGWDCDGKNGAGDPNTSMKCLINWLTTPGNYSFKWRGKCKDGKTKNKVCLEIANLINKSGVRFPRNAAEVLSKVHYIKKQFKSAYDFATSVTGAGLEDSDKGSFDD